MSEWEGTGIFKLPICFNHSSVTNLWNWIPDFTASNINVSEGFAAFFCFEVLLTTPLADWKSRLCLNFSTTYLTKKI